MDPDLDKDAATATLGDARQPEPLATNERASGPGRGPALIALGIALVITLGGGLAAVLTGSGHPRPPAPARVQAGVRAEPARVALAPVIHEGEPPAGVLDRLVVPRQWTRTGSSCTSEGVGLYDCQVELHIPDSPPTVLSFFENELRRLKWSRLSLTTTHHGRGTELLEQVGSNDGFYWDVGVFVDPVASSTAPAGGSTVEVRVVERDVGS